ncbi:MAG TPA: DUF4224 domain-containing protein [Salmonella bongori]|uniref:DUF4224 domain-containing protein n=3 Tax=Salmonella bongori TaxID=54736 RepID=S5N6L5_SALBN|nr:DUF4224 domain-containing protein [Salmonella bongori]EGE4658984.1 DUF4224 domain-containing protein [Salmonella bongori serovar 48:i:- str. 94-0708]AGR58150.1 hypothetical protein A464_964 [Salmonella bongori N268-08]ASG55232.1 hypothetical protein LFZ56_13640 [Salmonella bongori serovar 66:z41:- str. SA19983605]ECC9753440.1 DUF4224 domain-containing protein [Salmonella bongori]ECE6548686.1 DUF4224 domain-containing protein [Salmonella bongori]
MTRENDLLTDAELIEFTGYQKASKQREILDRGGVSYIPDREGRPMVTWTHINAVLNGQITVQTRTEEKPDFGAI